MRSWLKRLKQSPNTDYAGLTTLLALILLFLGLRLPGLGSFVTADEALWLRNSANFYYALGQGEWQGTVQSSHPGVTTMWAGAGAFQILFPDYQQLGQAETSDFQLRHLLWRKGINPVEVLALGRAIAVVIHASAFALMGLLLRKLFNFWVATASLLLLASDPFLIGHQRLLHQDGLLASFMLLATLAVLLFLKNGGWGLIVLSGLAGGLAGLTKSPGWFLVPFIFLILVRHGWRSSPRRSMVWLLGYFGIWLGSAALIFGLLYPAAWVNPVSVLGSVFQYALDSAEGAYSGPVFFADQVFPNGDLGAQSWLFYATSTMWRSTPLGVVGLLLGILGIMAWKREHGREEILWLAGFALFFGALMSLGTKKFDRYLLPGMAALLVVAGWGWAWFIGWLRESKKISYLVKGFATLFLIGLVGAQALALQASRPYYISYYNALLGGPSRAFRSIQMGWGEGMEQAAQFLLDEPEIETRSVYAWYSTSLNILFPFDAQHIPITPNLPPADLEQSLAQDYLVVYLHQWQRGTPANLLAKLATREPVFEYLLDGLPYVRVYRGGQ